MILILRVAFAMVLLLVAWRAETVSSFLARTWREFPVWRLFGNKQFELNPRFVRFGALAIFFVYMLSWLERM